MISPIHIAGLAHTDAMWFALAAETAATTHYQSIPPIVTQKLRELREAAEAFASAADYVGALLVAEGVEGVSTRTTDVTLSLEDDSDEDDEWP